MRARTCFDADEAGRQRRKELQQLRSANAFADHHRAVDVHAVNLKNRLRDIETDRANLAHGRLPSKWCVSTQPPYGTLMPQSGRRPQHQKQTSPFTQAMSALPSRADIEPHEWNVRFVPKVDSKGGLMRTAERREEIASSNDRDHATTGPLKLVLEYRE